MSLGGLGRRIAYRIGPARAALERRQRDRGVAFYRQFLGPGDLCLDIGANVGERCEMFRLTGAAVVAVEPQKSAVAALDRRFADDPDVSILSKGLGAEPGTATLAISSADSTISEAWRSEGRFADSASWDDREEIEIVTLDELIRQFGTPQFCKIGVEGYERQVIEGLNDPLPLISIEFTREFIGNARRCLEVVAALGPIETAVSLGERLRLDGPWRDPEATLSALAARPEPDLWGDIYIRSEAQA
ncbi:MAG: FkbM family methyltransferase [Solirubrobacterales bacterium]